MLRIKKLHHLLLFPLAVSLILVTGCQTSVSGSVGVSESSNGTTTVTGTVTLTIKPNAQNITVSDLQTAESSGYTVIANVPSSNFSLDSQNPVEATLTATTDQGYTSSVVVTLEPATSTTSPVASGYSVYTFAVPDSSQLASWVQSVAAHTTSTNNISASVSTVFKDLGTAGTYTFYVQVNSSQSGLLNVGSATYVDPGVGSGSGPCHTNNCPEQ